MADLGTNEHVGERNWEGTSYQTRTNWGMKAHQALAVEEKEKRQGSASQTGNGSRGEGQNQETKKPVRRCGVTIWGKGVGKNLIRGRKCKREGNSFGCIYGVATNSKKKKNKS